jgi:pimeloyl-ACP methyl ester carboxylesterase
MGHEAFAPTVRGNGRGVERKVNHSLCTDSIIDFISKNDLKDISLVGHSFGCTYVSTVVQKIPERIRRIVYLSGFVLRDGECLLDELPPESRQSFVDKARESVDDTVMIDFKTWRELFINDSDYQMAKWSYDQLSPQPAQPYRDRLDLKNFYILDTPKSYIYCTEDTGMPPGEEWGLHPRMSNRLGFYRLVSMPGSHEVMFSNPAGLAESLVKAARD